MHSQDWETLTYLLPCLLFACPSRLFSGDLFSIAVSCALGGRNGHPPWLWLMSFLGTLATDDSVTTFLALSGSTDEL